MFQKLLIITSILSVFGDPAPRIKVGIKYVVINPLLMQLIQNETISCEATQTPQEKLVFDNLQWLVVNQSRNLNFKFTKMDFSNGTSVISNQFIPYKSVNDDKLFKCCTYLGSVSVKCQNIYIISNENSVFPLISSSGFSTQNFGFNNINLVFFSLFLAALISLNFD